MISFGKYYASRRQNAAGRNSKSKPAKRGSLAFQPHEPSQHEKTLEDCANYLYDLGLENLAIGSGRKTEQQTVAIFQAYANLFAPRNIRQTREASESFSRMPAKKFPERFDRLAWFLLEGLIGRHLAPCDDAAATAIRGAMINVNGAKTPLPDLQRRLSQERSADKREQLWSAYVRCVEEKLNPLLVDRNNRFHRTLARHGFATELQFYSGRKRVSYDDLLAIAKTVSEKTQDVYDEGMSRLVRRQRSGRKFPGLSRAHESYLLANREFDRIFPARRLLAAARETFRGLGLDLDGSDIKLELETGPASDDGILCVACNAPAEIRLFLKPRGGAADYAALLHEAGQAWFSASMDPRLPFEFRNLGRSRALAETCAFLLESLLQNEEWLAAVLGLDAAAAAEVAGRRKLADLYQLRRHIGQFAYAMELQKSPLDNWRNQFNYHHLLSSQTGLNHDGELYLLDLDRGFGSADRLRARLAAAQLREHLELRYGQTWFRSSDASRFLRDLWSKGESWECEEMIETALNRQAWDPDPLLRRFAGLRG
ncbi:MAG: hypothetical protein WCT10_03685 [Patescibacteria group bacterium]|jgi:hypothetical protein